MESLPALSIDDLDPEDERSQEISTVSYIFPELTLLSPHSFSLSIAVTPEPALPVVFSDDATSTASRTISHLPPLQLTITLPESYPLESPPNIKLESTWVTKEILSRLQKELIGLWEEIRDQVLYALIDHLVQKAEDAFINHRGTERLVFCKSLEEELIAFNKKALKEEFNKHTYECGVCLEPKKGKACHRLFPCNHVFCINCLTDYYTTSITEGDVSNVKCLDPSCILNKKPKHAPTIEPPPQPDAEAADGEAPPPLPPPKAILPPTLPPEELEDLGLPAELVTRYRVLKRKAALDADPTTIYCPRSWCQAPSRSSLEEMDKNIGTKDLYLTEKHLKLKKAELNGELNGEVNGQLNGQLNGHGQDPNDEAEAPVSPDSIQPRERLDVCSSCAYSFCKVCLKGWHGDYVICRRKNGPKTAEELATEAYLQSAAAQCPTCGAHVIKAYGCNHMLCRCKTHFCFLCGAFLMASDPYKHFNSKENERCYMKLWEGEEGDGMAGRGVRPPDPEHPEEEEEEEDAFDDVIEPLLHFNLDEDDDFVGAVEILRRL